MAPLSHTTNMSTGLSFICDKGLAYIRAIAIMLTRSMAIINEEVQLLFTIILYG